MTPPAGNAPAPTPWQVLQDVLREDAGAPRVTFYERTPGPTQGERIELSGKVLVNWVSKAANLLSEEFDVEEGSRVIVHLPAAHWRTMYWCLAAWALGAHVILVDSDDLPDLSSATQPVDDADVLITCASSDALHVPTVVVTLAMLARSAEGDVRAGSIDEAKELSTFGDQFAPMQQPSPGDDALTERGRTVTFGDIVEPSASDRLLLTAPRMGIAMGIWAAHGSVVLVRGDIPNDELDAILTQESAVSA